MNRQALIKEIFEKQTYLCVGLDPDISKIPKHLLKVKDPIFEFNKKIIDATADHCVAYKPNIAFYESMGVKGWETLQKTISYIPKNIFTIADAKRGDIGNTSKMYASTFYDKFGFDAITLAPYMGKDSITPFLEFENKWTILLALTSNESSKDFQTQLMNSGMPLYEKVIETSQKWGDENKMMYVVGATKAESLQKIRKIIPNHFLLIPGIGVQGGSLEKVSEFGLTRDCGLLINSSRGIIYASNDFDFAEIAKKEAKKIHESMKAILQKIK